MAHPYWMPFRKEREEDLFSSLFLFERLSSKKQRKLLTYCHERQFEEGEIIFSEGDVATCFFVIVEGEVGIEKEKGRYIARLTSGDFFGEGALVDDHPRPLAAIALKPTRLLALAREDFLRFCRLDPPSGFYILHQLASLLHRKLLQMNELVETHVEE